LNLRMARGRPSLVQRRVGEALSAAARAHFAPLLEKRYIGITLQIDEGPEVYDSKNSTIHPLFKKD
ncbi:MAG: 5-carboxymethyl-2-hydroxymuconate isomerase, partial [Burkholderiales bacterium]|nr:5-carboxymethyl-2-hydroxymuconate isomerase [Burkholderiales bacterium]